MFKLREIQEQKSTELKKVVRKNRIGILAGEVRSGKTLTVLATAEKLRKKHVLFITKKKAISSILSDYKLGSFSYKLTLINYESIHKVETKGVDLVVCDESHTMGAFPKPSKRTKAVRDIVATNKIDLILASPEQFIPNPLRKYSINFGFRILRHLKALIFTVGRKPTLMFLQ